MMDKDFIYNFAKERAEKIFTKEYYKHVTDSWYLDEKFGFENLKIDEIGRKPTIKEADIYMKYLSDLFDEYRDKWYGDVLAQDRYARCIGLFEQIFNEIEYSNEYYTKFNIDEDTILKLKDVANVFVHKHNEFCNEIN